MWRIMTSKFDNVNVIMFLSAVTLIELSKTANIVYYLKKKSISTLFNLELM